MSSEQVKQTPGATSASAGRDAPEITVAVASVPAGIQRENARLIKQPPPLLPAGSLSSMRF